MDYIYVLWAMDYGVRVCQCRHGYPGEHGGLHAQETAHTTEKRGLLVGRSGYARLEYSRPAYPSNTHAHHNLAGAP